MICILLIPERCFRAGGGGDRVSNQFDRVWLIQSRPPTLQAHAEPQYAVIYIHLRFFCP